MVTLAPSDGSCAHGAFYGVDDYDPDHGPSYCACGRCSECDEPRWRWRWHNDVVEQPGRMNADGSWTCAVDAA